MCLFTVLLVVFFALVLFSRTFQIALGLLTVVVLISLLT